MFVSLFLLSCSNDKTVNINNASPEATIVSHEPGDTVVEGTTVEFVAALTDPNHDTVDLIAAWYANEMKMDDQVVRDAGYVVDFAIIGQLGLNKATFHQALDDCGRCQWRLSWHLWHKYLGSRYNWAAKMGRIMFSDGKSASVVRASSFVDEKDRAFLMQFRKHLRIVHGCVLCGELFGVYIVASLFYAGDSFVREPGAA